MDLSVASIFEVVAVVGLATLVLVIGRSVRLLRQRNAELKAENIRLEDLQGFDAAARQLTAQLENLRRENSGLKNRVAKLDDSYRRATRERAAATDDLDQVRQQALSQAAELDTLRSIWAQEHTSRREQEGQRPTSSTSPSAREGNAPASTDTSARLLGLEFDTDDQATIPELTRLVSGTLPLLWTAAAIHFGATDQSVQDVRSRADDFVAQVRVESISYNSPLEIFLYINAGAAAVAAVSASLNAAYRSLQTARINKSRAEAVREAYRLVQSGLSSQDRSLNERIQVGLDTLADVQKMELPGNGLVLKQEVRNPPLPDSGLHL